MNLEPRAYFVSDFLGPARCRTLSTANTVALWMKSLYLLSQSLSNSTLRHLRTLLAATAFFSQLRTSKIPLYSSLPLEA